MIKINITSKNRNWICLVFLMLLHSFAHANREGPGTSNLGPTGLTGGVYPVNDRRQIKIVAVDSGSPADGIFVVGDIILGVSGDGSTPVAFTGYTRIQLARAITLAEEKNPAILKLLRLRDGTTETVSIRLKTMGSYSATAPWDCPKSALILERGLDYIMNNPQQGLDYIVNNPRDDMKREFVTLLSFLASNDPSNPKNAARQQMVKEKVQSLKLSPSHIQRIMNSDDIYEYGFGGGNGGWDVPYRLIVAIEYYMMTKDTSFFPTIKALTKVITDGQSAFGTFGHYFAEYHPSFDRNLITGYGCINSAGIVGFYALTLAEKCGVEGHALNRGIKNASNYFGSYTHRGGIPYGEHIARTLVTSTNGKSGVASLAFENMDRKQDELKFFTKMSIASSREYDLGHTGPYFQQLWTPLGAAVGGKAAAQQFFKDSIWQYELMRKWDDSMVYNRIRKGYTNRQYQTFPESVLSLLTYALPLRQINLTGKGRVERLLTDDDLEDAEKLRTYDDNLKHLSADELIADLSNWAPKIRARAGTLLGEKAKTDSSVTPRVIALASSSNFISRAGACRAMGAIHDKIMVNTLVPLLRDPESIVRERAARALTFFPYRDLAAHTTRILNAVGDAKRPMFPLDESDPIQFDLTRMSKLVFGKQEIEESKPTHNVPGLLHGGRLDAVLNDPASRAALIRAFDTVSSAVSGVTRESLKYIVDRLDEDTVGDLAGSIVDLADNRAPADSMTAHVMRHFALYALKRHNYGEGVPVAMNWLGQPHALGKGTPAKVLALYAGSGLYVNSDTGIVDFAESLLRKNLYGTTGQSILTAIEEDTNPTPPLVMKTIYSVTATPSSLTSPMRNTTLVVNASDLAKGNSLFTWRKLRGAGEVFFDENGTAEAKETNVTFDGTPGKYLFEVTMSDSRQLTKASKTIEVILYREDGTLPQNQFPVAIPQSLTRPSSLTFPITLTGSDPEGYPLDYMIISEPSHGKLAGQAPFLTYTPNVEYVGLDHFEFRVIDAEGNTAEARISLNMNGSGAVPVAIYEPFDYDLSARLHTQSGSSEIGLDGSWVNGVLSSSSIAGYGGISVKGGSSGYSKSYKEAAHRKIKTSALKANGLLDDGATLWFSALVMFKEGIVYSNERLYFGLANTSLNSKTATGIGCLVEKETVHATKFFKIDGEKRVKYQTDYRNPNFGYFGINTPKLVVGKIKWAKDPTKADQFEIYLPGEDLSLSAPLSSVESVIDQSTLNYLVFTAADHVGVDEIRYGDSYESVLFGNTPMDPSIAKTAPHPNPMSFYSLPRVIYGTNITMSAANAYSPRGVEYYFTCTEGGGNDSGWQTGRHYSDTGLIPGRKYSYTVKARDRGFPDAVGNSSAAASVVMSAAASEIINFNQQQILSYAGNQDSAGTATVQNSGSTLKLNGNRWKAIAYPYTVTPNTIIEFDFKSSRQGEAHSIGFDNDRNLSSSHAFQLYGSESFGSAEYKDYTAFAPASRHYTIPVGQHFTGSFQYLFFVMDDDARQSGESVFSNIKIYEAGYYEQDSSGAGLVSIEAENYTRKIDDSNKAWTQVLDSNASGGKAMDSAPDDNKGANIQMEYYVNFVKTGVHHVWIRGRANPRTQTQANADSVNVGLDGDMSSSDRITGFTKSFGWSKGTMGGSNATINVTKTGVHILSIAMREDGFICDKIILTKNSNYTPIGFGSAESLLVSENQAGIAGRNVLPLNDWLGYLSPHRDANYDDISNSMAWALGASNPYADTSKMLPSGSLSEDSNYYIFEYRRNDTAHQDPNTTIKAEFCNTLSNWETAEHDGENIIITEFDDFYGNGIDKVELYIKRSMSIKGRLFTRLKVTTNEGFLFDANF